MSMWAFRKLGFILLLASLIACEKDYIYEVEPVQIYQTGSEKPNRKNSLEFISIAYADLFGTALSQQQLTKLSRAYQAFGDKELMEELVIKNLLNLGGANIPSKAEMQADTEAFVDEAYLRFYNREASNYERWFLVNMISQSNDIDPELIYFGLMSSEEYRYY